MNLRCRRTAPPVDPGPLQQAAANVRRFDWIVFASANGVDALFDAVGTADARSSGEKATALAGLPKIAAVGARTAERVRARGVDVALVPEEFKAEALVGALTSRATLAGAGVLLPRSEIGRESLADGLRAAGAIVTEVIAYRTIADGTGHEAVAVPELLARREFDAVTFTSGSAVANFAQVHGPRAIELLRQTVVAVIGPVTADAARKLGIQVQVQPATYTMASMVGALGAYFTSNP